MDQSAGELAELARTAVHAARVATLSTYPRGAPRRGHTTTVHVAGLVDGSLLAYLLPQAPAAQMLLLRPLATLRVAPAGLETVTLHGQAHRRPDADSDRLHAFQISAGAVRLCDAAEHSIDTARYVDAAPDLVRAGSQPLLEHLNARHSAELAACLRAREHDAETAEATALDRTGLTAVSVGPSGVDRVRLSVPAPVAQVEDLGPGLCAVLLCRCQPHR